MTQTPMQPTPDVAVSENRPTSLTVFAVLNMVFGGMGLLMSPINVLQVIMPSGGNPATEAMQDSVFFVMFSIVGAIAGVIFGIAMLIAGFGLIKDRPWGRTLSIFVAIAQIIWIFVAIPLMVIGLMPLLNSSDAAVVAGGVGGLIGGSCGMCIGFIYPVLMLYFMYRQPAKDWMAKQA